MPSTTPAGLVPRRALGAMSLVEMLVAVAGVMLIMVILVQITGQIMGVWKSSRGKISSFQNAREAFILISQNLSHATLKTHYDYVDASGLPKSTATDWKPAKFARASELHFVCGPTTQLLNTSAATTPGDAVFFQAPLGYSSSSSYKGLNGMLNSVGYFVQYGNASADILPSWMNSLFGNANRFQLLQYIEPTEQLGIYNFTSSSTYNLGWTAPLTGSGNNSFRGAVIAENVLLLIIRPRLSPQSEQTLSSALGGSYSAATDGSILCPNYHYDSRAWQQGYPSGQRVAATSSPSNRAALMRNQLPPMIDVVLVCSDNGSLARLDQTSSVPPPSLVVPSGLFSDSSQLDADLETFGTQLTTAKINYRVFRTTVLMNSSQWSDTY